MAPCRSMLPFSRIPSLFAQRDPAHERCADYRGNSAEAVSALARFRSVMFGDAGSDGLRDGEAMTADQILSSDIAVNSPELIERVRAIFGKPILPSSRPITNPRPQGRRVGNSYGENADVLHQLPVSSGKEL